MSGPAALCTPPAHQPGGSWIPAAREARGLTQEELARRVGVSRSAVAQWESGRASPRASLLTTLSETLSMSLKDLAIAAAPVASTGFRIRNLSVLAYANGFTLWYYKVAGELRDAVAPDYFADAADMLATGDIIMVSGSEGAAIRVIRRECNGGVELLPVIG